MKLRYLAASCVLLLSACAAVPQQLTTATIADTIALLQDTISVVQATKQSKTLTPDQMQTITTQLTKLNTDLTNLETATNNTAATKVATAVNDLTQVAQVLGPFVPTLLALTGLLQQAPHTNGALNPLASDVARVRSDLGLAS